MRVMAVDEERIMLDALVTALKASPDVEEVVEFTSCTEALQWITAKPADMAFIEINMHGMNGLTLAEHIMSVCPQCKVVFCTGCAEFAVEAFRIRASGYLLKPVTVRMVQEEIDHIRGRTGKEALLTVRCFGDFEVFYQGEILNFKRTKTKELLAFLVDRKGTTVTAKQICSRLWEDNDNEARNANYLYQLFDDLRHSLRHANAERILKRGGGTYAVDTSLLDCDYYRYLKYGEPKYSGKYMAQYSWAEETGVQL